MRRTIGLGGVLLLGVAGAAPGQSAWDFEGDGVGGPPAGFEFATTLGAPAGRWVVVDDGGNRVLAQVDDGTAARRFAMAVVTGGPGLRDLALSVRGKAISGDVDQAVGLVWRWQGPDDYYVVRTNARERNVRLYKVVNGNRIKFAGVEDVDLAAGVWQALAVEHRGTRIRVFLDGRFLFEARDETIDRAGRVGVWVKADSVTWFDDLSARALE